MSTDPVVVFASFRVKPDKRDELRDVLGEMTVHTRAEPGNEHYSLYASGDADAPSFHLFERYTSAEALDAHRDTDYYRAYRAKLPELLAEPIEVVILTEVDVQTA